MTPTESRGPLTMKFTPPQVPAGLSTQPARSPDELTRSVESIARRLYQSQNHVPYHGMAHALQIRDWTRELVARVETHGVSVDEVALDHAVLLHDALFFVAAHRLGFSSKEELAAVYACNTLRELGAPEEHAVKVWRLIIATHVFAEPSTPEEIIIRAADLKNVGGEYSFFRESTERLHREAGKLDETGALLGSSMTFEDFALRSLRYLSLYAWRFLQLTPEAVEHAQSTSLWHRQALDNLIRLFIEIYGNDRNRIRVIAQFTHSDHACVIEKRGIRENEFFVGVVHDDKEREQRLFAIRKLQEQWSSTAPVFYVPGIESATPLPDGSCDTVYVDCSSTPSEAARVLRPDGRAVILSSCTCLERFLKNGFVHAEGEAPDVEGATILKKAPQNPR